MNTMKKLVINGLWLAFGWLVAAGLCGSAWAKDVKPIQYQTWDPGLKLMVSGICQNYTVVKDTMTELNSGWYVVTEKVVIDRSGGELPGLKVNGDAHLILMDGAELVVTGATERAGIEVGVVNSVTNSLTIYGQQGQTGKLTATGGDEAAGIGGNFEQSCGIVTINGGIVTTTLIPMESGLSYSASIGGGGRGCGGVITINAGKVMATGCNGAVGIGTGGSEKLFQDVPYGAGCVITINGGEVTAIGGATACGIGGAQHTGAGKVTINGGTVLANGGLQGAGIGVGMGGEAWDVTITGGKVRAVSCGDFKGMLFGGAGAGIGGVAGRNGVTVTITGGEVEAISYPIEQGEEFYFGEGIGAGAMGSDPGTLDLSSYAGVKILVGMNTNDFTDVTEVQAGDFLDKGGVIGWHTNLYVHIMAGSTRPLGSPENPWNVGGTGAENAVQAYTNGNGMLVLEGEGLVVEKPWLGDGIKDGITEIMIKDRGVELPADAFIGMGADAEEMIVLKLPDGWQGNLPDATGVWQGAKVTIVTWPRMIRNVSFQQRYPWSGTVDITADVYGPESSGVQLVVSALNGRAPLTVSDENLDGDTVVDLTNGPKQVSFIWDATGEVGMENFRSTSVFVKVAFAEAGDPVETTIWKGYKEMVNWDPAYQHYLGEDGGGSDIPVGAEMRLYVQVLDEEGEEIDVQIHEGHWKDTFVDVNNPDTEIVDGHVSFTVTDEIAQFFRTPVGWGGLVVVQGRNAAVTKFSYFAPDRPVTYSAAGRLDLRRPIIVEAGGNDQITYSQTQWGRNLAGTAVNIRFGVYRAESLPICPGLEGLTGTGVAPFTYPTATGRYEFEHEILTEQQANAKAMAHPEVLVVWYVGADDPQSVYAYADGTGKVIVEGAGTPKALGAGDEPWAGAEPPITKIIVPTGRGPEFREKWPALAGMITGSPAPESDFEFDPDTGTIIKYNGPCGDVVIPSTIGGVAVTAIGSESFDQKDWLTSVTIPASVTSIGVTAFWNCPNLTSGTFAEESQLAAIAAGAFAQCGFTEITIPAGVTEIGAGAFAMCPDLIEVTVLAEMPPVVGDDPSMGLFDQCDSLTAILVPVGTVDAYKGADGWKEYADLITDGTVEATYYAWNGETVTGPFTTNAIPVTAAMTTLNSGWYVVNSVVSNFTGLVVKGDVHLILADGAELYVGGDLEGVIDNGAGICVNVDAGDVTNSISIYGQENNAGKLIAIGEGAGIGSDADSAAHDGIVQVDCGTITIHGGNVSALSLYGSGIGGGASEGSSGVYGGTITIYGGYVDAMGGGVGAGIGSGGNFDFTDAPEYDDLPSCRVDIYGGTVIAHQISIEDSAGGAVGAGIGGGLCRNGGIVNIYGGTVTAMTETMSAGIGSGMMAMCPGGVVTVYAGDVTAVSVPQMMDIGEVGEPMWVTIGSSGIGGAFVDIGVLSDPGKFAFGPASVGTILAGMDPTGAETEEVDAADFRGTTENPGWYTNCYVHITAALAPAAMIVTDNGATTNLYYSIQEAFDSEFTANQSVTNTVTLLRDYTETRDTTVNHSTMFGTTSLGNEEGTQLRTARLDLNGHILTGGRSELIGENDCLGATIVVYEGSVLIIDDSSTEGSGAIRKPASDPVMAQAASKKGMLRSLSAEGVMQTATIANKGDLVLAGGTIHGKPYLSSDGHKYAVGVFVYTAKGFTMSGGAIVDCFAAGMDIMTGDIPAGILAKYGSVLVTGGRVKEMLATMGGSFTISGGLFGNRGFEGMDIGDWLVDGVTLSPNTDPVTLAEGYNWKVAIPVPGSPANPWDIAAPTSEQPVQAYTNGNGKVVIEGEGEPKDFNEGEEPWAGAEPPITEIKVPTGRVDEFVEKWPWLAKLFTDGTTHLVDATEFTVTRNVDGTFLVRPVDPISGSEWLLATFSAEKANAVVTEGDPALTQSESEMVALGQLIGLDRRADEAEVNAYDLALKGAQMACPATLENGCFTLPEGTEFVVLMRVNKISDNLCRVTSVGGVKGLSQLITGEAIANQVGLPVLVASGCGITDCDRTEGRVDVRLAALGDAAAAAPFDCSVVFHLTAGTAVRSEVRAYDAVFAAGESSLCEGNVTLDFPEIKGVGDAPVAVTVRIEGRLPTSASAAAKLFGDTEEAASAAIAAWLADPKANTAEKWMESVAAKSDTLEVGSDAMLRFNKDLAHVLAALVKSALVYDNPAFTEPSSIDMLKCNLRSDVFFCCLAEMMDEDELRQGYAAELLPYFCEEFEKAAADNDFDTYFDGLRSAIGNGTLPKGPRELLDRYYKIAGFGDAERAMALGLFDAWLKNPANDEWNFEKLFMGGLTEEEMLAKAATATAEDLYSAINSAFCTIWMTFDSAASCGEVSILHGLLSNDDFFKNIEKPITAIQTKKTDEFVMTVLVIYPRFKDAIDRALAECDGAADLVAKQFARLRAAERDRLCLQTRMDAVGAWLADPKANTAEGCLDSVVAKLDAAAASGDAAVMKRTCLDVAQVTRALTDRVMSLESFDRFRMVFDHGYLKLPLQIAAESENGAAGCTAVKDLIVPFLKDLEEDYVALRAGVVPGESISIRERLANLYAQNGELTQDERDTLLEQFDNWIGDTSLDNQLPECLTIKDEELDFLKLFEDGGTLSVFNLCNRKIVSLWMVVDSLIGCGKAEDAQTLMGDYYVGSDLLDLLECILNNDGIKCLAISAKMYEEVKGFFEDNDLEWNDALSAQYAALRSMERLQPNEGKKFIDMPLECVGSLFTPALAAEVAALNGETADNVRFAIAAWLADTSIDKDDGLNAWILSLNRVPEFDMTKPNDRRQALDILYVLAGIPDVLRQSGDMVVIANLDKNELFTMLFGVLAQDWNDNPTRPVNKLISKIGAAIYENDIFDYLYAAHPEITDHAKLFAAVRKMMRTHAAAQMRLVPPAAGSAENPWDVGRAENGQPQAVTNGNNEVIVTGEGLPKSYGDENPAPWAGFEPPIETIYVPQGTEDIYRSQWTNEADKIVGVPDYLSFTAKDGDVNISFGKNYSETYGLEYSFDPIADEWTQLPEFDLNGTASDADKVLVANGQTLYIRKTGEDVTLGVGTYGKRATFQMERVENDTATIEAGGNVMSLVDQTCCSKEVGNQAFYMLFYQCRIMTTAPKLPATKLAPSCYNQMFLGCEMLRSAPELPAMELANSCYVHMFNGCRALRSAPELPAVNLAAGCYQQMFRNCSSLNYIKVGFDAWPSDYSLDSWLVGVASEGTFVCSQALENDFGTKELSYGGSTIPEGWRFARDYLSFTAKGGDIKLILQKFGSPAEVTFEYSFNAGATTWTTYSEPIQITKDQTVYFRKQGEAVKAISSKDGYWYFVFEGATVAAGGNVMSLLDPTCQSREIDNYGFDRLFAWCGGLVSAPRIDADTIGAHGCADMFYYCSSLTTAPIIAASEISADYSFSSMFSSAPSLNEITVRFRTWGDVYTTFWWVNNVAPFGVFRCPSELPIVVDRDHIPVGWIVFKKFSIPAIEGVKHSAINIATGEELAPVAVSQDGTKTYEVLAGGEDEYVVQFLDVDDYKLVVDGDKLRPDAVLELKNLEKSVEIGQGQYTLPERGVLLQALPADFCSIKIDCGGDGYEVGEGRDLLGRVSSNVPTRVVYVAEDGLAFAIEGGYPVTEKVQFEDLVTEEGTVVAPPAPPSIRLDQFEYVSQQLEETAQKVRDFPKGDKDVEKRYMELHESKDPEVANLFKEVDMKKKMLEDVLNKNKDALYNITTPEDLARVQAEVEMVGQNLKDLGDQILKFEIPTYTLTVENDRSMTTYSVYVNGEPVAENDVNKGEFSGLTYETIVKVVYTLQEEKAKDYAFDNANNKSEKSYVAYDGIIAGDRTVTCCNLGYLPDLDDAYKAAIGQLESWEKELSQFKSVGPKAREFCEKIKMDVKGLYDDGVPVDGTITKIGDLINDAAKGQISDFRRTGYQEFVKNDSEVLAKKYDDFKTKNQEKFKQISEMGTPAAAELMEECVQLETSYKNLLKDMKAVSDKASYDTFRQKKQAIEEKIEDLQTRIDAMTSLVTMMPIRAVRDIYDGRIYVDINQSRRGNEVRWVYLWFNNRDAGRVAFDKLSAAIGMKPSEVPVRILDTFDCYDRGESDSQSMPPQGTSIRGITAFVIVAVDGENCITRIGGVDNLDTIIQGDVKGADIVGNDPVSISYYKFNSEGDDNQKSVRAQPIRGGKPITLDGSKEPAFWVVFGDCTVEQINVVGEVTIILANGCRLSAETGINVADGATLYICSEKHPQYEIDSMGRLVVESNGKLPAAIYLEGGKSNLEIHGGKIAVNSTMAGIRGNLQVYQGVTTVTAGEGYAGVDIGNVQGCVYHGKLTVTGGAGAAAIGTSVGNETGFAFLVNGGLVRGDATPDATGACGAGVGAWAGWKEQGKLDHSGMFVFAAPSATNAMKRVDADYEKSRDPSVLFTTATEFVKPLPFDVERYGEAGYNLDFGTKLEEGRYTYLVLSKNDVVRKFGTNSTIGQEVWKTVEQVAMGDRIVVGELNWNDFVLSLVKMGVKECTGRVLTSGESYDDFWPGFAPEMVIACATDENGQIIRLGGARSLAEMAMNDAPVESQIGAEMIEPFAFKVVNSAKDDALVIDGFADPNDTEHMFFYGFTKEDISNYFGTPEKIMGEISYYIGKRVGTLSQDIFNGKSKYTVSYGNDKLTFPRDGSVVVVVGVVGTPYKTIKRVGMVTGVEQLVKDGDEKSPEAVLIGKQDFSVVNHWDTLYISMPDGCDDGGDWVWIRVCDENQYEALDSYINGLIGTPVGEATLCPLDPNAIPAIYGDGNWGLFRGGDTEINAYGYNKGERARGVIVFKTYPAEGGLDGAMMIRSVGGVRKVDKLQDGPALSNQYGEGLEYIVNQPLTVTRQSDMTFLVEPTGSLGTDESWMYATFTSDNDYNVSDLTEFLSAYQGAVVGDLGADFVRDIKLYNYDVECNTTSEGSFTVSEDTTAVILFKVKEDKVVATIGLAEDLDRLFDPGMSKGDTFCKTFITAQDFGVTRAGDALTASISSSDMYEVGQNDRIICFTFKEAPKGEAFYKTLLPTILNGQTEVGAWTMSNVGEENVDVIGTFTEDNLQIELPAGCSNVFVAKVHGANDVIVTLNGVLTSDVADGETQQPDVGIERICPFNFEVTHEEDGTFSLVSDVRKVHEGWVWLAFPSHVFYTLEPQYESAEAFLDKLRQEMVAYGATGSLGGKYVSNLSTLFTMLGDGYCGTSLDEALNVKNIPADTEIVVVYKLDRGTDKPLGEGIVIGLQDLGAGEKKQNQVDGRQVYATVDLDGTRTLHETAEPVETITELTPSIGGGRWYVVYDVRKLRESWTASTRRLVVDGEANIILLDNSLTGNSKSEVSASFEGGISVPEGSVLNIYGQRRGIAALSCQGLNGNAAIGGDAEQGCGTINIYGGVVQAVAEDGAAAIGGGYLNGEKNGTVNLYGGVVMARSADAAAIGGGRYGRGCDVTIGTAATAHCRLRSNDPTVEAPGIGGCDGFNNGLVDVYGENRVYIPLDGQGREYKDKAYYLGDVRRNNFFTSDLVTLTLPKDSRFQFSPASMLASYEAGALLPGDDANTYKIMRGDTVRVMAKIAAKSIGEDYGFRSPSTFMFDCVQGDVALAADELKIAMGRAITTMDFKVRRDANGGLYLSTTEKFDTNEQLVWVVIPSDVDAKLASSPIVVDPVDTFTRQMQGQGIQIGELVVDQYAAQLGAKNWNIVFDYAGEEIELPADALHVVAFKVFDAGKYASSGKVKLLSVAGGPSVEDRLETTEPLVGKEPVKPTRVSGRMPALKLGAINRIDDIASGDEWGNQVAPRVIARQPFTLTREEKGDFRLALHGELGAGEQWGYATINSMVWEAIKAGQAGNVTVDSLKELLDSQIGHPIGYFTIEHMDRFSSVFSKFEMSKECVFRLEPDTAAVMAFRVLDDKLFVSLGYVMDELQAMVPGGTDRKANMIDGQVDEPLYFITVENIPEHVKPSAVITWDTMYRTIEPDVVSKDFVIYSAPSGVNLTVTFEAADGWTIRSRDAASVKPVWRDETIDASFVYVVEDDVVRVQDFSLYRNEDKTFRFSVPDEKLDLEHGERWLYIAVGETDGAVGFVKSKKDVAAPISSLLWQYASEMIGKQIGKSSTSAEVFQIAMKNGYSGCVTELKEVTLPADTAMLIVCKCYTFTEESGLTRTYVITEGGCQDLQVMDTTEERHNELDDAKMSDIEVSYQYWDIGAGRFRTSRVYARYLTDTADVIGHGDWYVVEEGADLGNLKVEGTANLIVRDQTTLEIGSIEVGEGATLNIYGQGGRSGNIQIFNDAEDGVFAVGSADGVCGTINIHGVNARILCNRGIGIGGTAKGGELNVFGANLLASGYEKAIAGCTLNFYAGQLIAGAEDAAAVAIADDISLKSDKLMLLAGDDITALTPTTVTDYTANRQPFAKVVEYVNIIVPTVEYARATVSVVEPIERRALVPVTGEPLSDGWTVYKVERFGHAVVNVAAERGYTLRSPAAFAFYSIDSDKVIPVDVIAAAPAKPTQLIARQPFTVERTTDENGAPCFEVKPIGELGPGEMWLWMSCDATLAQTTGTVEGDKNQTTQEAIVEMLNQAIGRAPVGAASLDMYRYRLPIARCGVGDVDTVIRLANDTDLVLFSKVYDTGLDTKAAKAIRYYNITLGLATNLQTYVEGDAGHNEIGPKPTPDEIQQILEDSFPTPNEVTQNEDGTFLITLQEDMTGPVAIPDNIGSVTLDMNGYHITGTNSYNGAVGGSAIVITESGDVGDDTELTLTNSGEHSTEADVLGGNGADGQQAGDGGAAILADTKRDVAVNVDGSVKVVGGNGGTVLTDGGVPPYGSEGGAGLAPWDLRGDRAPGSVHNGKSGTSFVVWAKATLSGDAPANIATRLPEGATVVGNELWFWKQTAGGTIGFDFTPIQWDWIKDMEIRFSAGQYSVDQFIIDHNVEFTFVGVDSTSVVTPEISEEEIKPVVVHASADAAIVGEKHPKPVKSDKTVLMSTGKSIFTTPTIEPLLAAGPLTYEVKGSGLVWRNIEFRPVGSEVTTDDNGGAIHIEGAFVKVVVDSCSFAGLTAGQMGGAIYAAGLRRGALITNSTFAVCSVSDANGMGGAIYATARGGRVMAGGLAKPGVLPSALEVIDCGFSGNEAQSGGAICTTPDSDQEAPIELVLANSRFMVNAAEYNGGAICACGRVTIADAADGLGTLFMQNRAGVYGGALAIDGVEEDVFNSEVSVGSNTVFACNTVANDWYNEAMGGAIMLPTNCTLIVRNALFTNNVAMCSGENVYGVYGGAISTADGCLKYIEKTAFVDNAAIIENATSGNRYAAGGALSECGGVTLIDTCVFDGNTVAGEAAVGAALDLEYDEEATVLNSTFRNSNWEAVSVYDASAVIRNCVIVGNSVGEEWYDLYLDVGEVELTFSAFGNYYQAPAAELVSSNNIAGVTAAQVYDGETLQLATDVYNAVAALGYPQLGVTDFNGVEYGSTFWGTSMGAFETPAIYPVSELGFEITVDPQELAWTGLKVHPTGIIVTNPLTRAELTEGVDYTVAFENDTDATDQARVVVTGIGNYTGVATTNYWITSYLVRYYACEGGLGSEVVNPLEQVELGSLNGSNVVAKIAPPAGYAFDPFHAGTLTNGTVSLYDSEAEGEVGGRLVLNVFYAKSSGGDDDVPDKYQRRITYKVANGWWDGDEKNGADKSVWVTLYDGEGNWSENGTGTLSGIPAVGNMPFSGYAKAGVWYPAQPTTVEMPITRTSPAQPFFLYVYCPQPEGGSGRAGRGGTATVTQADLDALKGHLQTKFNLKSFSAIGPNITGVIEVGVVDQTTGHLLASDLLENAKVLVKSTPDLTSDEWSTAEVPTDGKGQFSFPKPEGVNQLFLQVESAEK